MSGLVDYLPDLLRLLGPIRIRRMFGGYGVYRDELFFAIVSDEVLYLKADAESAHFFTDLGLPRFEYIKDGKVMHLSYYAAPPEVLDDPEEAAAWARRALDAALRAPRQRGA